MGILEKHAMRPGAAKGGFTLVELLAVIAIAVLLVTFSATSFFGATQGTAATKARSHIRDVMLQTRQRASLDGVPYALVCSTRDGVSSYAVFRQLGVLWLDSTGMPIDPFGSLKEVVESLTGTGESGRLQVINLTSGDLEYGELGSFSDTAKNIQSITLDIGAGDTLTGRSTLAYICNNYSKLSPVDSWNQASIASRASQDYFFPKNYTFGGSGSTTKIEKMFIFNPDGTAANDSVMVRGGSDSFTISVTSDGKITIN